ncbi:MAG: hypothetical protein CM15mV75_620 [uncultured marine virus]|nr:MAG: hypothetical protein CM15mV75_620 [uncultured marine virus]
MKFAVKHDDRLDCPAMGVKYFTDALSISAQEQINLRKQEEWDESTRFPFDDPQSSANHLVLGMDVNQRQQARGNALKETQSLTGKFRGRNRRGKEKGGLLFL